MTCREKLAIEHPDKIDRTCGGGCAGCPEDYGYLPKGFLCSHMTCEECWSQEIQETEDKIQPQIDISALVNEAIEKKDRTIHILIMGDNISVDVRPFTNEKQRWIYREQIDRYNFECSECGYRGEFPSPYCPTCGEKLAMPMEEDYIDDTSKEAMEDA